MAIIEGGVGPDSAVGSAGNDELYGREGNDTLRGGGGYDRLYGDAGADRLDGGALADILYGGDGNDTLVGGDGGDALYPGPGEDRVIAGAGQDFVFLTGGEGPDVIDGGVGEQDSLTLLYSGLQSGQRVSLGSGNATDGSVWRNLEQINFFGGSGDDTVQGGADDDNLVGEAGDDLLDGASGPDRLSGGEGDDTLFGGPGRDILYGGPGNDRLAGGADDDFFYVFRLEGTDTLLGGSGNDTAWMTDWSASEFRIDTLADGTVLLTDINLADGDQGVVTFRSIEKVFFRDAAQTLGSDNSGDEYYDLTGPGGGSARGGPGDDLFIVDDRGDRPLERRGDGIDTVRASLDWTLGPNLEILELSGAENLQGRGNALANVLRGDTGNDTLSGAGGADRLEGGGGADVLRGGTGNDTLAGGPGADTFLFDAPLAGTVDTVIDFAPGEDRLQLDTDVFTALGTGTLDAGSFAAGPALVAAQDADDRVLYDTSTGTLYYDADGQGGLAAVAFAVLNGAPALLAADFLIVD